MEDDFDRRSAALATAGKVEAIEGDHAATAVGWLDEADRELAGVEALLDQEQWRLAFNAAYDIYRHAAEAVITYRGYRVTSAPGAHETTLALAHSAVARTSDVYDASKAGQFRGKRNNLEYLDPDRPAEVSGDEARAAAQRARAAVSAVGSVIRRTSGST